MRYSVRSGKYRDWGPIVTFASKTDGNRGERNAGTCCSIMVRWAGNWTSGLLPDIKLGWRRIIRAPGFAGVAVLSLAIAVGGNTALFSLIEGFNLQFRTYADPEELVDIRIFGPNNSFGTLSHPAFRELEDATKQAFDGVAGSTTNTAHLSDGAGRHDNPFHELVAGPYFQVLGVDAQIGRVFDPGEGVEVDADPVVVLSHEYWRNWFDGDPEVVGRVLWLNEAPYTIVGVAAPGFFGLRSVRSAFWAHASMADQLSLLGPSILNLHPRELFHVVGRLADGVTLADAERAVGTFADSLFATHPSFYLHHRVEVTPTLASPFLPSLGGTIIPVARLATGLLAVLLFLACLNLANLLLARAEERRHELATRLALGTRRSRLIRGHLTETIVLSLLGGTAGLYLSFFLMEAISTIKVFPITPVMINAKLSVRVLLLAFCMSLLAGLLMGLVPAIQSTRPGISTTLQEEHLGRTRGAARARGSLIVAQVALTALLAVAAVGVGRSLVSGYRLDPGFGKHPAAIAYMAPGSSRSEDERRAFYDAYLRRVTDIPGVVSAGMTTHMPLQISPTYRLALNMPGVDPPPGRNAHRVDWAAVGGHYFEAMGIPLLAGRFFDSGDVADSPVVAIVNETMAERYWPDQNPVGQKLTVCDNCWVTVVGVVGDTRARTLFEAPRPFIHTRVAQSPYYYGRIVAHTTGDPARVLPAMLALGSQLDSAVITLDGRTMEQYLSIPLFPLRISSALLGAIAGFALLLAAIGVYGIGSYSVAARRRELAIRMSVGADPSSLGNWVLRSTMKLIAAGLVIGSVIAVVVARAFRDTPRGFKPLDPLDFAGSVVLLAGIGALTTYLSARRAIRLDPVHALQEGRWPSPPPSNSPAWFALHRTGNRDRSLRTKKG